MLDGAFALEVGLIGGGRFVDSTCIPVYHNKRIRCN